MADPIPSPSSFARIRAFFRWVGSSIASFFVSLWPFGKKTELPKPVTEENKGDSSTTSTSNKASAILQSVVNAPSNTAIPTSPGTSTTMVTPWDAKHYDDNILKQYIKLQVTSQLKPLTPQEVRQRLHYQQALEIKPTAIPPAVASDIEQQVKPQKIKLIQQYIKPPVPEDKIAPCYDLCSDMDRQIKRLNTIIESYLNEHAPVDPTHIPYFKVNVQPISTLEKLEFSSYTIDIDQSKNQTEEHKLITGLAIFNCLTAFGIYPKDQKYDAETHFTLTSSEFKKIQEKFTALEHDYSFFNNIFSILINKHDKKMTHIGSKSIEEFMRTAGRFLTDNAIRLFTKIQQTDSQTLLYFLTSFAINIEEHEYKEQIKGILEDCFQKNAWDSLNGEPKRFIKGENKANLSPEQASQLIEDLSYYVALQVFANEKGHQSFFDPNLLSQTREFSDFINPLLDKPINNIDLSVSHALQNISQQDFLALQTQVAALFPPIATLNESNYTTFPFSNSEVQQLKHIIQETKPTGVTNNLETLLLVPPKTLQIKPIEARYKSLKPVISAYFFHQHQAFSLFAKTLLQKSNCPLEMPYILQKYFNETQLQQQLTVKDTIIKQNNIFAFSNLNNQEYKTLRKALKAWCDQLRSRPSHQELSKKATVLLDKISNETLKQHQRIDVGSAGSRLLQVFMAEQDEKPQDTAENKALRTIMLKIDLQTRSFMTSSGFSGLSRKRTRGITDNLSAIDELYKNELLRFTSNLAGPNFPLITVGEVTKAEREDLAKAVTSSKTEQNKIIALISDNFDANDLGLCQTNLPTQETIDCFFKHFKTLTKQVSTNQDLLAKINRTLSQLAFLLKDRLNRAKGSQTGLNTVYYGAKQFIPAWIKLWSIASYFHYKNKLQISSDAFSTMLASLADNEWIDHNATVQHDCDGGLSGIMGSLDLTIKTALNLDQDDLDIIVKGYVRSEADKAINSVLAERGEAHAADAMRGADTFLCLIGLSPYSFGLMPPTQYDVKRFLDKFKLNYTTQGLIDHCYVAMEQKFKTFVARQDYQSILTLLETLMGSAWNVTESPKAFLACLDPNEIEITDHFYFSFQKIKEKLPELIVNALLDKKWLQLKDPKEFQYDASAKLANQTPSSVNNSSTLFARSQSNAPPNNNSASHWWHW